MLNRRPGHLEDATVVFRFVGGMEIRRRGGASIMILAAGQPAEIGPAVKSERIDFAAHFQRNGVSEAESKEAALVLGVETGRVKSVRQRSHQAAEAVGVAVGVAAPGAFPTARDGIVRGGVFRGGPPRATETRTAVAQQADCEQDEGKANGSAFF